MLSPLFWLSCILRTTTGTTCTTKYVVPVVLVVVLYFKDDNWNNLYNKESCPRCVGCRVIFWGRQLEQLIQPRKLFSLFWLSCYILRMTTGTTYTTKKVVLVVLVVVLYSGDDNWNNLYNKVCCSRCFGCRVIFLGRQLEQLVQPRKLFSLFWLSCYIFRTKTETAYTGRTTSVVVQVGECAIHPFKHLHFDTPSS